MQILQTMKTKRNQFIGKYMVITMLAVAMTFFPLGMSANAQECRQVYNLGDVATISHQTLSDGSIAVTVSLNYGYYYICQPVGCSPYPDGVSLDWMTNVENFTSVTSSCSLDYKIIVTPANPGQPIGLGIRVLFHVQGSGQAGKAHGPRYI